MMNAFDCKFQKSNIFLYICFYLYFLYNTQWLEGEFMNYLSGWKASVESRPGFTDAQKALMCTSSETIEGLTSLVNCNLCGSFVYCICVF